MARRSKPFSAADRQRKKVQPQPQQPSPVKKPAGKDSRELDLRLWLKNVGMLGTIPVSVQQCCN